ncbi:MAG: hypothetical protein ACYDAD_14685, partial [Acidimicrobiales bacterium]
GAIFTAESRRGTCTIELELTALGVDYKHSVPAIPRPAARSVLLLVADRDVRVINNNGELLAEFSIDPGQDLPGTETARTWPGCPGRRSRLEGWVAKMPCGARALGRA